MPGSNAARCKLLTRTGLDWTHKYPAIAEAVSALGARQAYLDGELCGVRPDGITSFNMIQLASDSGQRGRRSSFSCSIFSTSTARISRRGRSSSGRSVCALLVECRAPLHYSDHQIGRGRAFYEQACAMHARGHRLETRRCALCARQSRPVAQGQMPQPRGIRRRRLDRSGRQAAYLGALLLGYYDPDGRLIYAGRVGTGIDKAELERLWRRLQPLATDKMPLDVPPPRSSRFGSPLVLSRVHWVRPELVAEVKFRKASGDHHSSRFWMLACWISDSRAGPCSFSTSREPRWFALFPPDREKTRPLHHRISLALGRHGGVGAGRFVACAVRAHERSFSVPAMMVLVAAIVLVTFPLVWWLLPHLRHA